MSSNRKPFRNRMFKGVATSVIALAFLSACSGQGQDTPEVDKDTELEEVDGPREGTWGSEMPEVLMDSYLRIRALNPEDTSYDDYPGVVDSTLAAYVDFNASENTITISGVKFESAEEAKVFITEVPPMYSEMEQPEKVDNCEVFEDEINEGRKLVLWRDRTTVYTAQGEEEEVLVELCENSYF